MKPEIVELIVRASFETKGLPEEVVKRAIKRVFRDEILNSDKWCFYNGREVYADVEVKIGNTGASIYFKVKLWQADNFIEVLNEKIRELENLIDELARQKELDEILNCQEENKRRTLAEVLAENRIDVIC